MTYYLNRERMRVVERHPERGNVTYRKRYTFGDEVDTSHLDEDHLQSLVDHGVFVESEDDLTGWRGYGTPGAGTALTGAATGPSAEHSEIAEDADDRGPEDPAENTLDSDPSADEAASDPNAPDTTDLDNPSTVDRYDEMDHGQLQNEAGSRGLSKGGSAQTLRSRLREADAG